MTTSDTGMPTVVFSMGDPNGIGPEVLLKSLHRLGPDLSFQAIVFGDPGYLYPLAAALGVSIPADSFTVIPTGTTPFPPRWGESTAEAGAVAGECLVRAVEFCRDQGHPLLVTAPVSKKALHDAGFRFPGQTEMIASFFPVSRPAMAFFSDVFHLMLATVHIPLRDLFVALTPALLHERCLSFCRALTWLNIPSPRVAVCGLNPHASEEGLLGNEEKTLITPVIEELRGKGITGISGPYPPDTLFRRAVSREFDGVVAMYHDQGLIPLKLAAFDSAVNTTLGLPILRTSPDHGTAFDRAGRMDADESSMVSAIRYGLRLVDGRTRFSPSESPGL